MAKLKDFQADGPWTPMGYTPNGVEIELTDGKVLKHQRGTLYVAPKERPAPKEPEPLPTTCISIDPGAKHVGMAFWQEREFVCAMEVEPKRVIDLIKRHAPELVVLEEFQLYPQQAKAQTYSPMSTSKLIGRITEACEALGIKVHMQGAAVRKVAETSPWGRSHTQTYGKPQSVHSWDAVCHGIYYHYFENPPPKRKRPRPEKPTHKKEHKNRDRNNRPALTDVAGEILNAKPEPRRRRKRPAGPAPGPGGRARRRRR